MLCEARFFEKRLESVIRREEGSRCQFSAKDLLSSSMQAASMAISALQLSITPETEWSCRGLGAACCLVLLFSNLQLGLVILDQGKEAAHRLPSAVHSGPDAHTRVHWSAALSKLQAGLPQGLGAPHVQFQGRPQQRISRPDLTC